MGFVIKAIIYAAIFYFVQAMLRKLIESKRRPISTRETRRVPEQPAQMVRCAGCGTYVPAKGAVYFTPKRSAEFYLCTDCQAQPARAANG